jgi:hypothetical protein
MRAAQRAPVGCWKHPAGQLPKEISVMQRLDGKRRASRQVPADLDLNFDFVGIAGTDIVIPVCLWRDQFKREHPERSDAEIDRTIFLAILDLMGDPNWEGAQ